MTNIKMLHWLKAVKHLKIATFTGACNQITKCYLNNSIISLIVRINKAYIWQLPKKQQEQAWAQIISSLHIGKTNEWLSAILKALNGWSKKKQWVCFTMFPESKLEKNIRVKGKNQLFPVGQSLSVFYTSQIKTSTNCKKKHLLDAGQLAHKFVAVSGCKKVQDVVSLGSHWVLTNYKWPVLFQSENIFELGGIQ